MIVHGNAGSVSQNWRPDAYRSLSSNANAHVVAIDYRGFGYSTGTPTEAGLVKDAYATLDWAIKIANVPAANIVLVGQSLGTAVVAGAVDSYLKDSTAFFAGLVLVAGFPDLATLLPTYAIGGFLSILSPFRVHSALQVWLSGMLYDPWRTKDRLGSLVARANHLDLTIIHARNDLDIPWQHSDTLFYASVNGTSENRDLGFSKHHVDSIVSYTDRGAGEFTRTWVVTGCDGHGTREIRQDLINQGGKSGHKLYGHGAYPIKGHNRIITYPIVARAVMKAFGGNGGEHE